MQKGRKNLLEVKSKQRKKLRLRIARTSHLRKTTHSLLNTVVEVHYRERKRAAIQPLTSLLAFPRSSHSRHTCPPFTPPKNTNLIKSSSLQTLVSRCQLLLMAQSYSVEINFVERVLGHALDEVLLVHQAFHLFLP